MQCDNNSLLLFARFWWLHSFKHNVVLSPRALLKLDRRNYQCHSSAVKVSCHFINSLLHVDACWWLLKILNSHLDARLLTLLLFCFRGDMLLHCQLIVVFSIALDKLNELAVLLEDIWMERHVPNCAKQKNNMYIVSLLPWEIRNPAKIALKNFTQVKALCSLKNTRKHNCFCSIKSDRQSVASKMLFWSLPMSHQVLTLLDAWTKQFIPVCHVSSPVPLVFELQIAGLLW